MTNGNDLPPEDRPPAPGTGLRVLVLAEALSAWLFLVLSAWFYFQPEGGALLSGVLASVALIDPPVMGIVVRQIRSRNAAQASSDGLPPPPGSVPGDLQTSLSLTVGAVVLGVGLTVFLAVLDAELTARLSCCRWSRCGRSARSRR